MQVWYKYATNRPSPPDHVTIAMMTTERVVLYICVPPPGENIVAEIDTFTIEDSVPNKIKYSGPFGDSVNTSWLGPNGCGQNPFRGG